MVCRAEKFFCFLGARLGAGGALLFLSGRGSHHLFISAVTYKTMRLLNKYSPKKVSDLIGQEEAIVKILFWLEHWKKGKGLFLHGPPGVGKSSVARAFAIEKGVDLIELNASDERSADEIEKTIGQAVRQQSLFKRGKIVLIDEVDGLSAGDRGGAPAILKIIQTSTFPVILTANDIYEPKLKALRQACEIVSMKKIPALPLEKLVKKIAELEKISLAGEAKIISEDGDSRAALIDLEPFSITKNLSSAREREKNIYDTLRKIFFGPREQAREAIENCSSDANEIFAWVKENAPAVFNTPQTRAEAFEIISKADLLRRKSKNFIEVLLSISTIKKSTTYVAFKPPARFWAARPTEEIFERARENHCSVRKFEGEERVINLIK